MTTHYCKIVPASLDRVGEEYVLLCLDQAEAFTLSDSGAVLWEALDHFAQAEELEALLVEARPDLGALAARDEVRQFLDNLVRHGLLAGRRNRRVRKIPNLVAELVGSELIVLSRGNRKVHLFNESGALLWEALEQFSDSVTLQELVAEAWPSKSAEAVESLVEGFLDQLLNLGLVSEAGG